MDYSCFRVSFSRKSSFKNCWWAWRREEIPRFICTMFLRLGIQSKIQSKDISSSCSEQSLFNLSSTIFKSIIIKYLNQKFLMKSFSKQICKILSFSGYKSHGFYLPCSSERVAIKCPLTYKLDIAHQIYHKYSEDSYKFSEKGITPQTIAEEIIIYMHKSPHYHVQIDSFGYILITPSQKYYKELEKQIQSEQKISNLGIEVEGLDRKLWSKPQKKIILYDVLDLSLSSVRISLFLSAIFRKTRTFNQNSQENVLQIVVHDKNISQTELKESKLIDFTHKYTVLSSKQKIFENLDLQQWHMGQGNELVSATLRHNCVPFAKEYQRLINKKTKIFSCGEVFPKISLGQINQFMDKYQYSKLMSRFLVEDLQLPIDLKIVRKEITKSFELIKGRSESESLLILLEMLAEDRLIQLFNLAPLNDQYYPFIIFKKQLCGIMSF